MVSKLAYSVSEREHWISGAGGLIGIFAMITLSHIWFGDRGSVFAISSMGSTAVLLFAMPHGAVSQPWPVMGGHLVSALVGVTCARWLGYDPSLAAAVAVGGAGPPTTKSPPPHAMTHSASTALAATRSLICAVTLLVQRSQPAR
jgi:CBS-domain-containing membrane protein